MSNIHLLVPDLFLPKSVVAEACAGLALPALETLLARAQCEALPVESPEAWLCEAFGVAEDAVAAVTLLADGLEAGTHYWLRSDPVHLSLQRDQSILHSDMSLSPEEAAQLCAGLSEHFAADGLRFFAPHSQRWYLRLDDAPIMRTSLLAEVEGRNAHEYLPQGADALRWHGVLNEIQMLLYGHPVNQAREVRGELPINSVWLWGGGRAAGALRRPCDRLCGDNSLAAAFAHAAGIPASPLPDDAARWFAGGEGDALLVWEGLRHASRRGDLYAWREELQRFERHCARPLWEAVRAGRIARLTLDTFQDGGSRRFALTRGAAWKLWRRPLPLADYATH